MKKDKGFCISIVVLMKEKKLMIYETLGGFTKAES